MTDQPTDPPQRREPADARRREPTDPPQRREPADARRREPADPRWRWEPADPRWREPTDAELCGRWPDPFAGPPDGPDAWLAHLSAAELDMLAQERAAEAGPAGGREPIPAGFTHRDPGPAAAGFAAGGPLDLLAPDPVLAGFAADAVESGLGTLSDDELIGLLCAARRLSSWQAAMEFAAVIELDGRRRAQATLPGSSRANEHVAEELAAALTLTGRSAAALLELARGLARLPAVLVALTAGVIDRARAAVFADELSPLGDIAAAAVAAAFWSEARGMTTGQLRAALRRMVLAIDPDAARRRAEQGRGNARVESWPENSGNAALAGRELPPAEMIAADQRIDAIARALKAAGAAGSLDQLRAAVFTALLTGRDPQTLAPPPDTEATGPGAAGSSSQTAGLAGLAGSVHLTMPLSSWLGHADAPGETASLGPLDAGTCRDLAARLAASGKAQWCLTLTGPSGRAVAHACARTGPGPDPPSTAWLAALRYTWLEHGSCTHQRQTPAYQPGRALRHLIEIRHRTCAFPGCRRPARRCDIDHTIPYDQGGRTCECGIAPACRRHHRAKQAPGWHLAQPAPGTLIWTTPSGRVYTVHPDPYPV